MLGDYDFEALINAIAEGWVTTDNLPKGLYLRIAEALEVGLEEGYGASTSYAPDEGLLMKLRTNVYEFSAAKTYQEVRQVSALLTNDKGIRAYSDFKKNAEKILKTYNEDYLRTEYNTAIGQAQSARKWEDFTADAENYDYLIYDAVMDANTSDICRPLDGITLPVNDPFWNTHAPLNHWNCRCFLRKVQGGKATEKAKYKAVAEQIGPLMDVSFKTNSGKSGEVFTKKHPYYDVPKKDKDKVKQNFGMPIPAPKKDKAK